MVWQRGAEWVGTEVEDSFVMINLETGTYLTLNRTANAVWTLLETPQTVHAIEAELTRRFDVTAQECARSVAVLLDQMQDLKIAAQV